MPESLPNYQGVYDRLFIAPTVFIGLGRWGNAVCDKFFRDVLTTLSPSGRQRVPTGAPTSLLDCFSRLSWVRDMDRESLESGWARDKQFWPAKLDEADGERFSDVTGADSLVSFWSTPRSCFRASLAEQWDVLGPTFKKLLDRVSSANWREGCEALGLQVPVDLDSTDKWIVTVGSLFEPEVGIVIADLARFVQQNLRAGESGYKFLHLVDVGIPPDPEKEDETWVTCPRSLQTQMLASCQELQARREQAIYFYCTSTDRSGFRVAVEQRMASAVGVLRCYFTGALLSPRIRNGKLPSVFKNPEEPRAVTGDRSSIFLEFALDLSNLGTLIAHELLARWKRQTFVAAAPIAEFEALRDLFTNKGAFTPGAGRSVLNDLISDWLHSGLNPRQNEVLESFRNWIVAEKERMVESLRSDSTARLPPMLPPDNSLLGRIKTFVGFRSADVVGAGVSRSESLRQQVEFSDEVLESLGTLIAVIQEIATPESAFQDRTNDDHLEIKAVSPSTYLARYKRLPLDADCPPVVREVLSGLAINIPKMILDALPSPEQFVNSIVRRVAEEWKREIRDENPEKRWEGRGIVQWIRYDESLAVQIAAYATRRLTPLWKPFSERAGHWSGFLTIFDYGVQSASEPTQESASAVKAIGKALARPVSEAELVFGVSRQAYSKVFDTDVYWERWPSMFSIGLLWTDTPHSGMGFHADWDSQEFAAVADAWSKENPAEAKWSGWRRPEDVATGEGSDL